MTPRSRRPSKAVDKKASPRSQEKRPTAAMIDRLLRGEDRLLTPEEMGELFRVDAATATRWAQVGKLTSIRTPGMIEGSNGHHRFFESEVCALLLGKTL